MVLTPEMARRGITPQLSRTTKQITCPKCGKNFSLFQSRAIACVGCPKSGTSCNYALLCIHCDAEFPLTAEPKWVTNRTGEKVPLQLHEQHRSHLQHQRGEDQEPLNLRNSFRRLPFE